MYEYTVLVIILLLLRSNVLICIVSFENTGNVSTSYTCGALHIAVCCTHVVTDEACSFSLLVLMDKYLCRSSRGLIT